MVEFLTHNPANEAETAELVRGFHNDQSIVEIGGGFTKTEIGKPIETRRRLSSAGMSGIVNYEPSELVITAKAGTPMDEITAALDKANQRLTFEPTDFRKLLSSEGTPTIGALAAANLSGSRRYISGSARDSLLGVRFVNGKGEIIKNGGRVMKNVTGLDLVKLLAGSWGTLGFLTEVTFKVLPKPETEQTLVLHGLDDEFAVTQLATALGTSTEVSGAAHLPELVVSTVLDGALGTEAATCMRLEGFDVSIKVRLERLKEALGIGGEITLLDEAHSKTLWQQISDVAPFADGARTPVWKISMAPSQGWRMVDAMRREAGMAVYYDWQGGLIWARMDADTEGKALRAAIQKHGGGHATLYRGIYAHRQTTPVFQPQSAPIKAVSQRIKATFDPNNIFNPGRMGI